MLSGVCLDLDIFDKSQLTITKEDKRSGMLWTDWKRETRQMNAAAHSTALLHKNPAVDGV